MTTRLPETFDPHMVRDAALALADISRQEFVGGGQGRNNEQSLKRWSVYVAVRSLSGIPYSDIAMMCGKGSGGTNVRMGIERYGRRRTREEMNVWVARVRSKVILQETKSEAGT